MKIETILKITREYQFTMSRNAKESLCLLISSAVRSGDIDKLAELIDDPTKSIAKTAITSYQNKIKNLTSENIGEVA